MNGRNGAPVLEFEAVRLPLRDAHGSDLMIDATLTAGELVLIQPGDEEHEDALADGASGLLPPKTGRVRFLGRDWHDLPADQANALRGRIGRVFGRGAWVSYMSVLDNILLAQLYHTRRRYDELRAEAARLATWFGLPGLPADQPARVSPADLQRAACVRAFLGVPSLLILESAFEARDTDLLAPLINAVRWTRDRDGAVLWFARDPVLFHDRTLPASQRLQLRGNAIVTAEIRP